MLENIKFIEEYKCIECKIPYSIKPLSIIVHESCIKDCYKYLNIRINYYGI